jgi:CO/xanthine dehydrogenase FAD-binding subunit
MGTIGGNLGTASPAGDALPFLVAAEADIVLVSSGGERRVPVDEFLTGPKQNALLPGEVILGVELPADLPPRQAFAKVGVRQAMVIAVASTCVIRSDDGTTRVALGAVGPKVLRATEAEEPAATGDLDDFQALVSLEAQPITDHRATAEYRRHAVGVIARRALERTLAA